MLDRMEARLAARPELLDQRREIVEHPFGTIKHWMDQGTFLMRGLENVRAEFSLTALAYNLRRAINILGVNTLIAGSQGLDDWSFQSRQHGGEPTQSLPRLSVSNGPARPSHEPFACASWGQRKVEFSYGFRLIRPG